MGTPNFEQFERELHALMLAVERECVEAELARYGLDVGEYKTFELGGLGLADSPAQGCFQVAEGVAEACVLRWGLDSGSSQAARCSRGADPLQRQCFPRGKCQRAFT